MKYGEFEKQERKEMKIGREKEREMYKKIRNETEGK